MDEAYVLRLSELDENAPGLEDEVGRKAAWLLRLHRWGFPVPDSLCIPASVLESLPSETDRQGSPHSLWAELARALGEAPLIREAASLAVRSSGIQEEREDASFAGLYETVLGARASSVPDAIRRCLASRSDPRVTRYAADRGLRFDGMPMSVLIQPMVEATKSGVVFTVDPVEGRDTEVLIEACHGLGDTLVSGAVTPDRYRFDWFEQRQTECVIHRQAHELVVDPDSRQCVERRLDLERAGSAVLSTEEVRELSNLAVGVQAEVGAPVDLEWAKSSEGFVILQCRPITRIGFGGIEGQWTTADLRDGGVSSAVCSPLMASLYESVMNVTLPRYLDRLRLPRRGAPSPALRVFFGRPYWNLGEVRERLARLPGHSDATFYKGLGINVEAAQPFPKTPWTLRSAVTGLRALWELRRSIRRSLRGVAPFALEQRRRLEDLETFDPGAQSREALFSFYARFLNEDYVRNESAYFEWVYDNSNLTTQFREAFDARDPEIAFSELLLGLQDLSHLRPMVRLWELVEGIRSDEDAVRYWTDAPFDRLLEDWRRDASDFHWKRVRDYTREFGHLSSRELDITVPGIGEDPTFLFENIRASLAVRSPHPSQRAVEQRRAFEKARDSLLGELPFQRRHRMARRLCEVRAFLWWREELRELSTRFYHQVRRLTLAVASHLCEMGTLQNREDVFLLSMQDLFGLANGDGDQEVRAALDRNRTYVRSFRHFQNPNEIGLDSFAARSPSAPGASTLIGVACSPGIRRGPARVISSIREAYRLRPGDILVTPCTDPAWTRTFSMLAGVVTETGGILSHAAVISREYGLPAVLAVEGATGLIRDGQLITVDGSSGHVRWTDGGDEG